MENISKQVVSLEEKKCIGYVLKPLIDFSSLKKVGYIVVEEETEQEFLLRRENILFCRDIVLISSSSVLEISNIEDEFRKKVLSTSGEDLGNAREYVFQRNFLRKIVTDRAEISSKYIVDFSNDIIFVSFKKRRTFPRFLKEDMKVEIMDKKLELPPIINLSPSYYLGKVATKTLLGINNELIIKEGTVITKPIFDKAKRHNKINELFFICK